MKAALIKFYKELKDEIEQVDSPVPYAPELFELNEQMKELNEQTCFHQLALEKLEWEKHKLSQKISNIVQSGKRDSEEEKLTEIHS